MNSIITFFKKNIKFSNFWIKNGLILVTLSILINHLTKLENFPLNKSYKFPWFSITISILLGSLIIIIARFNFIHFKNKYFAKKINLQVILHFLFSTLGYITIIYISFYYVLNGLVNGIEVYNVYHLLLGLSITLLLSSIIIAVIFSTNIYKLYKFTSKNKKLKVKHSGKITLVNFTEIAFIYSENKIVYIVKIDGNSIATDFTLNKIEDEVRDQNFFRANRQTIIHSRSIEQVKSIENRKLLVLLKPPISGKNVSQINISKYKRQEFMTWFENKL